MKIDQEKQRIHVAQGLSWTTVEPEGKFFYNLSFSLRYASRCKPFNS
jgi:hypothetical protein